MPIGSDTWAYGSRILHLVRRDKTYFVTWCTAHRTILPPAARDIVLSHCVAQHQVSAWLTCVTVMPDHVHMIITPHDDVALARVIQLIKGASARAINLARSCTGSVWQRGWFDHILRSGEKLHEKIEYVANNPVEAGLVGSAAEWPWF